MANLKKNILTGILKGIARIPLPLLYVLSDIIYQAVYYMAGYRKRVVRDNLRSCFPDKLGKELLRIEKEYYHFLCDVIVETLKLFHISDKELSERVKVENAEAVNRSLEAGTPAVLLLGHYGNWEWVQEITRHFIPGAYQVSIYHPLSNKLWDTVFTELRSRWQAHIVPMKKAVRTLLDRDNFPWVCGFIADHRPYRFEETNAIEFLNHKTYFIYGPEEIGAKVNASFFYLEMLRERRGHYKIIFHPLMPQDFSQPFPHTRLFWKYFEKTIKKAPQFWMWSHKRWK